MVFEGYWVNRGVLQGGKSQFTFEDGPCVPVRFLGLDELELELDGQRHHGVLQKDGTLKWDDGDVWRRGET